MCGSWSGSIHVNERGSRAELICRMTRIRNVAKICFVFCFHAHGAKVINETTSLLSLELAPAAIPPSPFSKLGHLWLYFSLVSLSLSSLCVADWGVAPMVVECGICGDISNISNFMFSVKKQLGSCKPVNFFFWGGGDFFIFYVQYSALLHLPPLRFHCADGCWSRTQDRCN